MRRPQYARLDAIDGDEEDLDDGDSLNFKTTSMMEEVEAEAQSTRVRSASQPHIQPPNGSSSTASSSSSSSISRAKTMTPSSISAATSAAARQSERQTKKKESMIGKCISIKDIQLDAPSKGCYIEATIVQECFGLPRAVISDSQGYSTLFDYSTTTPTNQSFSFSEVRVGNVLYVVDPQLSRLSGGDVGIQVHDPRHVSILVKEWTDFERLRCAKECRARGNLLLTDNRFDDCVGLYQTALMHLDHIHVPLNEQTIRDTRLSCHLNLCAAFFQSKEYDAVLRHSDAALHLAQEPVKIAKALYRRGQAFSALLKLDDAEACFHKAQTHVPEDLLIAKELRVVAQRREKEKEREMYARMLKGLSSPSVSAPKASAKQSLVSSDSKRK